MSSFQTEHTKKKRKTKQKKNTKNTKNTNTQNAAAYRAQCEGDAVSGAALHQHCAQVQGHRSLLFARAQQMGVQEGHQLLQSCLLAGVQGCRPLYYASKK